MYSEGQHVLLIWGAANSPDSLKNCVDDINSQIGSSGKVQVENVERLALCTYISTKCQIYSFHLPNISVFHKQYMWST